MSHLTKAQLLSMPMDQVFKEYLTEYVRSKAATAPVPAVKPRSPVKYVYGKKNGSHSASRTAHNSRVRDLTKKERAVKQELLSPRRSPRKQVDAPRASISTEQGPPEVELSSSTQLVRRSPRLLTRSRKVWSTSASTAGLEGHSPAKIVAGMRTSAGGSPSASRKNPGKAFAKKLPRAQGRTSPKIASGSGVKVTNGDDAIELTDDSEDSDVVCLTETPAKKRRRILPRDPARAARRRATLDFLSSGEEDWDALIIKPKKKHIATHHPKSPKFVEGSVNGEEEEVGAKYAYVRVATGETYYGQIIDATPSP